MCSFKQSCEIDANDHLHSFSLYAFLKIFRPNFYFIFEANLAHARTKCTSSISSSLAHKQVLNNLTLLHQIDPNG